MFGCFGSRFLFSSHLFKETQQKRDFHFIFLPHFCLLLQVLLGVQASHVAVHARAVDGLASRVPGDGDGGAVLTKKMNFQKEKKIIIR